MTLTPLAGAPSASVPSGGGAAPDSGSGDAFAALLASPGLVRDGTPQHTGASSQQSSSQQSPSQHASPQHTGPVATADEATSGGALPGTPSGAALGPESVTTFLTGTGTSADALAVLSAAQVAAAAQFLPVSPILVTALRLEMQPTAPSTGPDGSDGSVALGGASGVPGASQAPVAGMTALAPSTGPAPTTVEVAPAGTSSTGADVIATPQAPIPAYGSTAPASAPASAPATAHGPAPASGLDSTPTAPPASAGASAGASTAPSTVHSTVPSTAPSIGSTPSPTTPERAPTTANGAPGELVTGGLADHPRAPADADPTAAGLAGQDGQHAGHPTQHHGGISPQPDQNSFPSLRVDGLTGPVAAAGPVGAAAPEAGSLASYGVTGQVFGEVTRLVSRGDGTQRITLNLQPEVLGDVRVVLTVRGGEVHVRMAGGDLAQQALLQGAPELHRLLDSVGATTSRIVVGDTALTAQQNFSATAQDGHRGADQYLGGSAGRFGDGADQPMHHRHRGAGTRHGDTSARDGSAVGSVRTHLPPDPGTRTPSGVDVTM